VKYFEKNDSNFKIVPKLLDHVEFKRHSLFDPLKSIVKFDIIFLRNVLIYFKKEEQEKVLAHIANALKPNGTLVIGESESLKNIETRFEFSKPLVYQLKAS
jgi:chemotaxis protein methyltransferase CheR